MHFLLISILLALSPVPASAPRPHLQSCIRSLHATLDDSGVGPVRLGMPAPQVLATCPIVRDTVEGDPAEDLPQRVLSILVGADTIRAILDDGGLIHRLEIVSPFPRTREGWGVGTPLPRLLKSPRTQGYSGAEMELALYIKTPGHCGMTFRVPWPARDEDSPDSVAVDQLRRLPRSARVTEVNVFGCHR
jgi:hypothetical protein